MYCHPEHVEDLATGQTGPGIYHYHNKTVMGCVMKELEGQRQKGK